MTASRSLEGVRVLVTRPAAQAENLCAMIEALGGVALKFPALAIDRPENPEALRSALARLDRFDWAVFVSANAVDYTLDALVEPARLPARLKLAAVGRQTAHALERRGYRVDVCPSEDFSSEGLLAQPALQSVGGQRFVIFRGNGGRDELARTLVQRGAEYEYVEAYRRQRPPIDVEQVRRLQLQGGADFVLATSAESLENIWAMLHESPRDWIACAQLVVASRRLVPFAARLGFVKPALVADNATDRAMVDALIQACAESGRAD